MSTTASQGTGERLLGRASRRNPVRAALANGTSKSRNRTRRACATAAMRNCAAPTPAPTK
eukprot:6459681-Amphidinium_carterae.1